MTRNEYATEFRIHWRAEILETAELRDPSNEDLLWYWDTNVEARIEDGSLPKHARSWAPPRWLFELNRRYVAALKGPDR